jgi:ABC-type dipeptide/oligopeptide/nickel transport system permease subunit
MAFHSYLFHFSGFHSGLTCFVIIIELFLSKLIEIMENIDFYLILMLKESITQQKILLIFLSLSFLSFFFIFRLLCHF